MHKNICIFTLIICVINLIFKYTNLTIHSETYNSFIINISKTYVSESILQPYFRDAFNFLSGTSAIINANNKFIRTMDIYESRLYPSSYIKSNGDICTSNIKYGLQNFLYVKSIHLLALKVVNSVQDIIDIKQCFFTLLDYEENEVLIDIKYKQSIIVMQFLKSGYDYKIFNSKPICYTNITQVCFNSYLPHHPPKLLEGLLNTPWFPITVSILVSIAIYSIVFIVIAWSYQYSTEITHIDHIKDVSLSPSILDNKCNNSELDISKLEQNNTVKKKMKSSLNLILNESLL